MKNKLDLSPTRKAYPSMLRVKKIKGNLYLYEVTPYYDPVTKKRSQESTYLRKIYPFEDLQNLSRKAPLLPETPPKVKEVKAYGDAYVFHHLVEELGLRHLLLKCFSEEDTHLLLLLTGYRLLSGQALQHLESWMESSDLLSFYPYSASLSSPALSKTLHHLGKNSDEVFPQFFLHWSQKINRQGCSLLFDITSFSSQAREMEVLEYGYSKDASPYPQLNLGLLVNAEQHLPLYYEVYPGSLKDVSLLARMAQEAHLLGIPSLRFILDRGFYSRYNLEVLQKQRHAFLLPLPRTASKLTHTLMHKYRKALENPERVLLLKGKPLFALGAWVELPEIAASSPDASSASSKGKARDKLSLYMGMYLDPQRQQQEQQVFLTELLLAQDRLQKIPWTLYATPIQRAEAWKEEAGKWAKYLSLPKDPQSNEVILLRNKAAIEEKMQSQGIMILLSSTEEDLSSMLQQYRERDEVEKLFDAGKNELEGTPLRVHRNETMKSTLFVLFLSLIVQCYAGGKMKEAEIEHQYSLQSLFRELHKLKKALWNGKTELFNEMTKTQQTLLQQLHIVLPNF
jgi:transposase